MTHKDQAPLGGHHALVHDIFQLLSAYFKQVIHVTVHAKTSLVHTKIEIHFLPQVPMCRSCMVLQGCKSTPQKSRPIESGHGRHANWSAFLGGGLTTL